MKAVFILASLTFIASTTLVASAPAPINPLAVGWCARFRENCNTVGQASCGANAFSDAKCDVVFNGNICQKVNIAKCWCWSSQVQQREVTLQVLFNVIKATNGLCATQAI
ncbi:hypothetical protein BG000_009470 [Podila horticola]|nr:hypothetical protein BG000_009470 [Podila horticola]